MLGQIERRLAGRREQQARAPDAELVAVGQAPAPAHPLSVHERAVAREAVVDQRPVAARALEDRVHARDLGVPRQRDLARRAAADVHERRLARQRDDPLPALAVAEQHVGRAVALGREGTHLDRARGPGEHDALHLAGLLLHLQTHLEALGRRDQQAAQIDALAAAQRELLALVPRDPRPTHVAKAGVSA